ncbi:MAG: hypothetical protein JWL75_533 [Parcubacteria group bacterium]|nr:hypothetical protein [Parcubacteria group bacterium]
MSEKPPKPAVFETKEALNQQEIEDQEQARLFANDYPAPERDGLSAEQLAEKIKELEDAFENFEQTHDIAALAAIQLHTYEEAKANTARESAKEALPAIVAVKNVLERQSQMPDEIKARFHAKYRRIQAAIGRLTDTGLDHSFRS